jgi:hypothetical protein
MDNTGIQYVTPTVEWTANLMSIRKNSQGEYPIIEYGRFKNNLTAKAKMISDANNSER